MYFYLPTKFLIFFRRLFAEGAFAQAFVPVLSEYHTRDEKTALINRDNNKNVIEEEQVISLDETRRLIAQVSGTLGVVITLVTLFGMLASPLICYVVRWWLVFRLAK